MDFKLKLLPEDKIESKIEVLKEASSITTHILQRYLYMGAIKREMGTKTLVLLNDIQSARFWDTLSQLDGYTHQPRVWPYPDFNAKTKEQVAEEAEAARKWARDNFSHHDLESMLNLAVNQAFIKPFETCWPGTRRPHAILYEHLVEHEGSMFASAVTPKFKKRLNNGRFWESLPDAALCVSGGKGIRILRDVLENHFEDLDTSFLPYGIQLMEFGLERGKLDTHGLQYMGETALDHYAEFMGKIEASGFSTQYLDTLVKQYIRAVLSWDGDYDDPFYNGGEGCSDHKRGSFVDKLKAPVVQSRLAKSDALVQYIAKKLASGTEYCSDEFGQHSKFVAQVIECLPQKEKVTSLMLRALDGERGVRLVKACRRHGYEMQGTDAN